MRNFITVGKIGDIDILECTDKRPPFEDAKFTYHCGVRGETDWFQTADIAFLGALGYKYDGLNSQFVNFAVKMLDMLNKGE
ncbi:MAG: hypothetical protein PHS93_09520 [Candidatus Omnitrophica bacterium]|jgi:hypothetical protein|nr:hypothetical protein [Candidatus Omnitrophota bacterium]